MYFTAYDLRMIYSMITLYLHYHLGIRFALYIYGYSLLSAVMVISALQTSKGKQHDWRLITLSIPLSINNTIIKIFRIPVYCFFGIYRAILKPSLLCRSLLYRFCCCCGPHYYCSTLANKVPFSSYPFTNHYREASFFLVLRKSWSVSELYLDCLCVDFCACIGKAS